MFGIAILSLKSNKFSSLSRLKRKTKVGPKTKRYLYHTVKTVCISIKTRQTHIKVSDS